MKSNRSMQALALLIAASAFMQGREVCAAAFADGYVNQDLLLNFRQFTAASGAGTYDVTFDLGNVNTFLSTYSNQRIQINSADFARPNAYDPALLTGAGGANYGNLNNLLFGVVATDFRASVDDMWATRLRGSNPDSSVADSTAWTRKTAFSQSTASGKIDSAGQNANNFGTTLSPTAARTTDSTPQSYNTISTGGTFGYFNTAPTPTTEGGTGPSFGASDVVRLDFYDVSHVASGTAPATYKGYFELEGDGDLFFVGSQFVAVPEPSTYGMIAGLGLLALGVRRRINGK